MLITKDFDDYEIISMSDGEKLERWGKFYLLRPDPEIIWKESLDKSIIHAYYHRSTTGGGYWDILKKLPSSWCVNYKDLTFNVKLMGFKHTGVFPEQSVNWDYMREKIKEERKKSNREIKVLNLFAYTGCASVACLKEGGSIIIASYLLPLLISLSTNLIQSSTKNLIGLSSKLFDLTFSLAQSIIPRLEST